MERECGLFILGRGDSSMPPSAKHATILITGASRGIGEATAYHFAREKYRLILTYNRGKKEVEKVAKKCLNLGAEKVDVHKLDLMKKGDIQLLAKKIKQVDWLINNAGVFMPKPLNEKKKNEIELELRTNLEGTITLTHQLLPKIKQGVLTVSSVAGIDVYPNMAVYCASKFGLCGFMHAMALDYPALAWHAVLPGYTATRMTGFKGTHPSKVGKVILEAAKGKYHIQNGENINAEAIIGE